MLLNTLWTKTITRSDISCFLFYFCWSCQRHQRESCSIKAIKSEARWNLLDNGHDLLARGCRISLAVMSETKDSSWAACRNLSLNKLAATPISYLTCSWRLGSEDFSRAFLTASVVESPLPPTNKSRVTALSPSAEPSTTRQSNSPLVMKASAWSGQLERWRKAEQSIGTELRAILDPEEATTTY